MASAPRGRRPSLARRSDTGFARALAAITELELPPIVFRTCPWQPRDLVEAGLRQWLRCCAAALRDGQVIGMPSHAVDEAWHGLILCTARYQAFCDRAYGRFMHHRPLGDPPTDDVAAADSMAEQLRRTVIAWSLVALPGEQCLLWDLDDRLGLSEPWSVDAARVAEIETELERWLTRPRVHGGPGLPVNCRIVRASLSR